MLKLTKSVDQIIFDLVLFVFFTVIAVLASGYKPVARELPLPAALIGSVLTLLLLLTDFSPYLYNKFKFITFKANQIRGVTQLDKADQAHHHPANWVRTGRTVLWLVLYVLAISYIGYLIATFCFVLLLSRFEAGLKLKVSLFSAIGCTVFFYAIFNLILNASF